MAERQARLNLYRSLLGLLVNLVANFVLIPIYGTTGAATGTLISFITAYLLFDFMTPRMRPMALLKLHALLVWPTVQKWSILMRSDGRSDK